MGAGWDEGVLLIGRAYGREASLELTIDSLIWRASRGDPPIAENIATTPHDVRVARLITLRWSPAGFVLAAIGAVLISTDTTILGAILVAIGVALVAARLAKPRRFLALDLGARTLALDVPPVGAAAAQAIVDRCASSVLPASPPTLP